MIVCNDFYDTDLIWNQMNINIKHFKVYNNIYIFF